MKYKIIISNLLISLPLSLSIMNISQAETTTVNKLLDSYKSQGVISANAKQGEILWKKKFKNTGEFSSRSCTTCHTNNLTQTGKHIKTNKTIKPMSPAVTPERLTKVKKINKWFKRNCKWTIGRECTAQEKANILSYIENKSTF